MPRSTYARIWIAGAVAVAAIGLAAGLASHGPGLTSIAVAFIISLVAFVRWGRLDRPTPDLTSARATGVIIAITVVGALGLGLWWGRPGFLLLMALAVFAPRALETPAARASTSRRDAANQAAQPAPADPGVRWTAGLTNPELCDGWCESFLALRAATSTEEMIRIAHTRQDYLDEIEARNQPAFRRWLANEPRASSSPARLLADLPAVPADDEET